MEKVTIALLLVLFGISTSILYILLRRNKEMHIAMVPMGITVMEMDDYEEEPPPEGFIDIQDDTAPDWFTD